MVLFEIRAVDNGDSIKDLLHHIDDPMVRPSSTFLVLLHLAAYELLVDATRELRPLDKLTPTVSPASSGDILVSFAHHPAAPSPIRGACCKRLQCHHEGIVALYHHHVHGSMSPMVLASGHGAR